VTPEEPVLVLSRSDVERLLDLDACIDVVERAFRLLGEGRPADSRVLGFHVEDGGFHVKAGLLELERPWFAAKVNGNFPSNPARTGLPTIQGVILLADARNGRPLAIIDSLAVTARRTAAATAVAARRLARPDARVATIVGCGVQGRVQLEALRAVLPIDRAFAVDREGCRADLFADECSGPGLEIVVADDLGRALAQSDVVVTCTPSREPIVHDGAVRPGTFIAAVGADHPEKQEIAPRLMAACTVVVDDLGQCTTMGDLHHAIEAGFMGPADVHAALGELVAGRRPGRTRDDEITIFDSTGLALQDVAACAVLYERAARQDAGVPVSLAR
jgi:alanine dehydrogenase